MTTYTKEIEVRWTDLDANKHVTHIAYASFATHSRVSWMEHLGFSMQKLLASGIHAVLQKEQTEYFREVFLGEKIKVKVYYSGRSIDNTRWKFKHEIYKADGKLAAISTVYGAWLNNVTRKITVAPEEFLNILETVVSPSDFEIIDKR